MKKWAAIAGLTGALGVLFGSFGAHALADRLDAQALQWWKTGVQYHLIHAVLLAVLALHADPNGAAARAARWGIFIGIVVFSGTLYAMALGAPRWLGAVTPLGGLALIVGWLAFAFSARDSGQVR